MHEVELVKRVITRAQYDLEDSDGMRPRAHVYEVIVAATLRELGIATHDDGSLSELVPPSRIEDAFRAGCVARECDTPRDDCPWPEDTLDHHWWTRGYAYVSRLLAPPLTSLAGGPPFPTGLLATMKAPRATGKTPKARRKK